MCCHRRRIELDFRRIRISQSPCQPFPDPVGTPAIESLPNRVGFPVTGGQVIPGNSSFQHVKHSFYKQPVIGCDHAGRLAGDGRLPDAPGLGIDFDETIAQQHSWKFWEAPHLVRRDGSVTNW